MTDKIVSGYWTPPETLASALAEVQELRRHSSVIVETLGHDGDGMERDVRFPSIICIQI